MSRNSADVDPNLGGTIASRVAGHLSRAVTQTRVQLGPHQAAVVQKILADFTNHVSDEVRGVMSPLWLAIAADEHVPDYLRALARNLGTQRGQAWAFIASTSTGAAMGGGLGNLITNELNPVITRLIGQNPNGILAPGDAAALEARGLPGPPLWEADAAAGGLNPHRFRALVELNYRLPTTVDVIDLLNRGHIDEAGARSLLRRSGFRASDVDHLLALRAYVTPLPDLAAMWNRSIVDDKAGAREAGRVGASAEDWRRFTELTGEPLAVQDLFTALRRGFIDEARARRGWVQGPVRNEWFDVALALQYAPMSYPEAAEAVNANFLDEAAGRRIAMENGLRAEDFSVILQTAGLPPGVELASEALNRGLLTPAEFRQAFLESRLKNKYVDLYEKLRYRVIPQETVRRLYRAGTYDLATATERLGWAGFSPEDSAALLAAENADDTEAIRDLNKSEIIALYESGTISESDAGTLLADLGYSGESVAWLLGLADLRRVRRYTEAAIARVRSGYVARRLDEGDASTALDTLRVPPGQRDELIAVWDEERQVVTRGLTTAQVQAAMRRGLIDADGAYTRFLAGGYSPEDAEILVSLAAPAPR